MPNPCKIWFECYIYIKQIWNLIWVYFFLIVRKKMNISFFEKCKYLIFFFNFERRLPYLIKKSDIWAQIQSFDLVFFPEKPRPGDSSERFQLPIKLSPVCLSTLNIYRSPESPRWPIATSLYPSSSIVRRSLCRSLTTTSQKLLCQYNLQPLVYCTCKESRRKIVNFMTLNLRGLTFGIKTVKFIFFVKTLLLYSRTCSRQCEYIIIKSRECSNKIVNIISLGTEVLV